MDRRDPPEQLVGKVLLGLKELLDLKDLSGLRDLLGRWTTRDQVR